MVVIVCSLVVVVGLVVVVVSAFVVVGIVVVVGFVVVVVSVLQRLNRESSKIKRINQAHKYPQNHIEVLD